MSAHPQQPLAPMAVVILISGSGRNLQVFLDAAEAGALHIDIKAVISNRPDVQGLERARNAGVPIAVVNHQHYPDREQFDAALAECIDAYVPDIVVLAGFMRILTPSFVNHYAGRMLNVHPSLLPAYRGLNTYQRALDDDAAEHGVSVHYVTPELDGGPVVLQGVTEILPGDTAQSLEARVHQQELVIYPAVVQAIAQQRLQLRSGQVWLDNQALPAPLQLRHPEKSFQTHYTQGYETTVYEKLFSQAVEQQHGITASHNVSVS